MFEGNSSHNHFKFFALKSLELITVFLSLYSLNISNSEGTEELVRDIESSRYQKIGGKEEKYS